MEPGELLLGSPGARVLLVGSGTYAAGSRLSAVPAVAATVSDLGRCLVEQTGLDQAHLTMLIDPASPVEFGQALVEAAGQAREVLVVYYVGHGLVDARNELHLATRATVDLTEGIAAHQALPYWQVGRVLEGSRAPFTLVVLDCCFAGRAGGVARANTEEMFRGARHGMYLLAATGRDQAAWAPQGEPYTAFSGALIRLLVSGDPTAPGVLTLDDVHRSLARTLADQGFPEPHRHVTDHGHRPPFAPNAAYSNPDPGEFSPYRGLAAFGPDDSSDFFGREELTANLLDRVTDQLDREGPLLVTGPSGSGKSSLLRAGLIAHLDVSTPGAAVWLTPGADPVRALAARFAPADGSHPADVRRHLEADPGVFRQILRHTAENRASRPVIVVDQFEEVFTAPVDEQQRRVFVQALHAVCAAQEAVVVLGMRADFSGHCTIHAELITALEHPVIVSPMTTAQLREAIEKPAEKSGLTLQTGLVDLILEDLGSGGAAGTLPLLSYTLLATWQHREGRTLTLAGYRATGGISQSLARSADAALGQLNLDQRKIARRLIPQLVRLGEGTEDTGRTVSLADLGPPPDTPHYAVFGHVLDHFVRARLITVDHQSVALAHEALIRGWPQLRTWIEADRAGLIIRQRLVDAARAWQQGGRDAAELYRGSRLSIARDWAAESEPASLDPATLDFLQVSDLRERTEQRAARRRFRFLVGGAFVLTLLLVATAVLWQQARQQSAVAEAQARIAAGRALAAEATVLRDSNPQLALRLGIAAASISADTGAKSALVNLVARDRFLSRFTTQADDYVRSVAFSADRRTLAAANEGGSVTLWDIADPAHPRQINRLTEQAGNRLRSTAFSPVSPLLAAGSEDGTVVLWDLTDPARPTHVRKWKSDQNVEFVAFSPDGQTLATAGVFGAHLWDITRIPSVRHTGGPLHCGAKEGSWEERSVTFSPRSGMLALRCDNASDNALELWDVTHLDAPHRSAGPFDDEAGNEHSVAFSPNGRFLAVGGGLDGVAYLWDLAPSQPKKVATLIGHAGEVTSLAFSPSGVMLATASADKTAILWDVTAPSSPRIITTLAGYDDDRSDEGVATVAFSRDGRTVATGSQNGSVTLWDAADPTDKQRTTLTGSIAVTSPDGDLLAVTYESAAVSHEPYVIALYDIADPDHPRPAGSLLNGHKNAVLSLAFSPHRRILASGDEDGAVILWNVADRRNPRAFGPPLYGPDSPEYPRQPIDAIVLSSDGNTLVAGDRAGVVTIWDVRDPANPKLVKPPLTAPGGQTWSLAFNRDDRTLAISTYDMNTGYLSTLFDVSNPVKPRWLASLPNMYDVSFKPDGETLTARDLNGSLMLWDVTDRTNPRRVAVAVGREGLALGTAFSHTGHLLAVVDPRSSVVIWDVTDHANPHQVATMTSEGSNSPITFSSDDGTLVVGGGGTIHLWNVARIRDAVTQPVQRACSTVRRGLTEQEWQVHVVGLPFRKTC
ncbi:caspase, EACC1-associated type [Sphaerisporangium perillae]|uniref:caspase, EACC1-associated type n=1 Tax=Sphaerisporangium perillae TaxID=2935860 RepID=UPI00200EE972|nr:caspase family protein [Sphaerisporangium perillae]